MSKRQGDRQETGSNRSRERLREMSEIVHCDSWKLKENLCFLYSMYRTLSEEQQMLMTVSALYMLSYDEKCSC